jgi:HPt (histidine-containing phosphotransfer) domain-containing protein
MNRDAILDLEGVMDRLENDTELYNEIVQLFFDGLTDSMGQIKSGLEKGDAALLGSSAHATKGALGNIGAMRAYGKAYELEQIGKSGNLGSAPQLVSELEREIEAFRGEYQKLKGENRF